MMFLGVIMSANSCAKAWESRAQPMKTRHTWWCNKAAQASSETSSTSRKQQSTHICILSVNSSGRHDPRSLFIFIDGEWICVDVALDDLETGLVCDTIAVAEGRVASILVSRHDMGKA